MKCLLLCVLVASCLPALGQGDDLPIEEIVRVIEATSRLAPKGRVQDPDYNPESPLADLVRDRRKEIVAPLIDLIPTRTPLAASTIDFWPTVGVGDVAFITLVHLFSDRSQRSTAPGMSWSELLEVEPPEAEEAPTDAYGQYQTFVSSRGREALRDKWQEFWMANEAAFSWNEECLCFDKSSNPPSSDDPLSEP